MRVFKNFSIYLALILLLIFLFFGGPSFHAPRSYDHMWDLGHIFLFGLLAYVLVRQVASIRRRSFYAQLGIMLIFGLLFGILTEMAQANFNRHVDLLDLFRDILGALAGVVFFSPERGGAHPIFMKIVRPLVMAAMLVALYPLSTSLIDESLARRQFPVLSDLEAPFELSRWSKDSRISISDRYAAHGDRSLEVQLSTAKYSGAALKYFPSDWTGYTSFEFSLYNPQPDTLLFTCRINDVHHANKYSDRYNRKLSAVQGWNRYRLPLDEIRLAPTDRQMDMQQISLILFFTSRLSEPRTIYLDHLILSGNR